ncbi:MAG TPA: Ricin and poly(3-hydroxybutyrate) depolymerase fusion [Polyangiaceae bacterium]|nr:Ricin and poly(3-hydroxybutyrate) depolymerase fusion [Polyangiaceae bacterium]
MVTRFFVVCVGVICGCSSSDGHSGNNGMTGTGGATGGGSAVTTGGSATATGGSSNLGSGGTVAGATGGGNNVANGGSNASSGGSNASSGGSNTNSGGGGAATGGAAGAAASGGAAQGGQTGNPGDVSRSAGCGMTAPMAGDLMMDVMGTSREYILTLPANYDPTMPYRLVFAWHGLGGTAQQVASNWYGLKSLSANSTIFVAGQGLETTNSVGSGPGWPNTNGEDVAFVKALYAKLQGQLCFDQNRVFSVGMSYGGIMSDTLGCQMGDVFRAIAPMSGEGPGFGGRGANCVGQVAVWMSNGDNDTVVPTAQEEASRDFWVSANHCQMQSMPVDPSPCVAYQGCDAGNPVTWCEFMGGHTIPPFAASAIWKFFSQF